MLLMVAPLFSSERIKWHIIGKKIVFLNCVLRVPLHDVFAAGDRIARIVLSLDDAGWHARLYRSDRREDREVPPIEVRSAGAYTRQLTQVTAGLATRLIWSRQVFA